MHKEFVGVKLSSATMRIPIFLGTAFLIMYLCGGFFHTQLSSDPRVFWAYQGLALMAFPVGAYSILIYRCGIPHEAFGWRREPSQNYSWKEFLSDYIWLVAGWAFGLAVVAKLLWLFLWPIDQAMQTASMRPEDGFGWLAVGVLWSIEPAIIEETFFRGFLWTMFDRLGYGRKRPGLFIFWSGILFGLGHLAQGITVVLTMMLVGFFLGWHYSKVQRLLPFVLAHLSVNLFMLLAA